MNSAEPPPAPGAAEHLLAPLIARPRSSSGWRMLSWDDEQGICVHLESPHQSVLLLELEARDPTRPCWTTTAFFNLNVRPIGGPPRALTDDESRVGEAFAKMVRIQERTLAWPPTPTREARRTLVSRIAAPRVLVPEGAGTYYLNPYVGCTIGCSYCYVMDRADLSRRLSGRSNHPWGHWVDVKIDAADKLAEELRYVSPGVVRLSPIITDPYMKLERHFRITRQCLELLLPAGFHVVILTRSKRVTDDLDLLSAFPGQVAVGLSIPSDDDAMRRIFEPRADPIPHRLDALRQASEAGVRGFSVIQPMLPMDEEQLAARMAPFVTTVRIDRMHDTERVRHLYEQANIAHAMTAPFFDATEQRLRSALSRRGVRVDALDDLRVLFRSP